VGVSDAEGVVASRADTSGDNFLVVEAVLLLVGRNPVENATPLAIWRLGVVWRCR